MLSVDVMNSYGFAVWTTLSRGWAFVAATFIIIVPLVQEVYAIWRQYRLNQQMSDTRGRLSSQTLVFKGIYPP